MTSVTNCGACGHDCTDMGGACNAGKCASPCGTIPTSGNYVCVVYSQTVGATDHVGLAGGINAWNNPWTGCVNTAAGQNHVLCNITTGALNPTILFRPALFATVSSSSTAGTFDCDTATCFSEVYLYENGTVVSSYDGTSASNAKLSVVTDQTPPNYKDFQVTP